MHGIILLYKNFEEIEALGTIDILRRADIKITSVGLEKSITKGARDISAVVDAKLSEINSDDYDFLIVPGGAGYKEIIKSGKVHGLIRSFHERKKLIAAICAGPLILQEAGVLKGVKATTHPLHWKELEKCSEEKVVFDKNFITSQGPGTTFDFALKIVEVIKGKASVDRLKERLIHNN